MPIGEIELHPYLEIGKIQNATKLILGSFPVYECTNPDNELKRRNRVAEGTIRFFYGSSDSSFWRRYSLNVDNQITLPPNNDAILQSLLERNIAIADTIVSCQRHEYSSEDTSLFQREWNKQGIIDLIEDGVTKILCTSKGVLNTLHSTIICPAVNPFGELDEYETNIFHQNFIQALDGNTAQITTTVARVFNIGQRQVKALALPSPGSPQRQLKQFGLNGQNWRHFADHYFESAFNWFTE